MANCYYVYTASIMAKIALAVGKTADALGYLAVAAAVNPVIAATYLSASAGYWDTGSQVRACDL